MISELAEILETHYIESRKSKRHAVDELGSLCEVAVGVRNVSRGGVQIACARAAFEAISERAGSAPVAFELLVEPRSLAFTAKVVYEREEGDVHLVGLQFVNMTPAQESDIDSYINQLG